MRTKLQALQHIMSEYLARRLGRSEYGQCLYRSVEGNMERHCAVGSLFDKAQLDDLVGRGLNHTAIWGVTNKIGRENIEAVTGMSVSELKTIQRIHDSEISENVRQGSKGTPFYRYLKEKIELASTKT